MLWGGSWLVGAPGGATFLVRTLQPQLGQAYLKDVRGNTNASTSA